MESPHPPLVVERLAKTWRNSLGFARLVAVRDLSFTVGAGRVLGLIGPNGSGKTTAIRCALGFLRPTRGAARVFGSKPLSATARRNVGFAPERFEPTPSRTGRATLELLAAASGLDRNARRLRAAELLERFELAGAADRAVGGYSKGMRRRLGIAQALLADPRLVVLDEPFDGLDPLGALLVRDEIATRAARGVAFVLSSHQLGDVEAVATDLVVMDRGSVVTQGEKASVLDRPGVLRLDVADLEPTAIADLAALIENRGGRIVSRGNARESLEELFRRRIKGGER
jgi:ABC-2 type transport system ATP-binding protein